MCGYESQKIVPPHESNLAGMESFRRRLIRIARYRGHQAEDVARLGNFQYEYLPSAGTDGEFYFARTEHEYTARFLSFEEETCARRIDRGIIHGLKICDRACGQMAEKCVPFQLAALDGFDADLSPHIYPSRLIYRKLAHILVCIQ